MRIPAKPANIEPIDQLIIAITFGECPSDAAATSCFGNGCRVPAERGVAIDGKSTPLNAKQIRRMNIRSSPIVRVFEKTPMALTGKREGTVNVLWP